MTIFVWRIMFLVSLGLFVAGLITLLCTRLLKNKYFQNFAEDELMKNTKTANSRNSIYSTSGEAKSYIKKYVICKTAFDNYLVCNYSQKFSEIAYFVVEYTKSKRVICAKQVTEVKTGDTSRVIALSSRCAYVNIIIGAVNGMVINNDVIRPMPVSKIRLYAFLKSFTIFLGLFAFRHILIEIIGGEYMRFYLNDLMNYLAIAASLFFSVMSYLITVLCFRKKNKRALTGGALEYEFI